MSFLQRYLRSLLSSPVPGAGGASGLPSGGPGSGLPWWRRYLASLVGVPLAGAVRAEPFRRARPVRGRRLLAPAQVAYGIPVHAAPPPAMVFAGSTSTGRRRLPRWLGVLAALGLIGGVAVALLLDSPAPAPDRPRPTPTTTAPATPGPTR